MKKLLPTLFLFATLAADGQQTDSTTVERSRKIDRLLNFMREFRVISYVQIEWQQAQTAGETSVAGGNFPILSNNRFMIRRGRAMFLYDHDNAKGIKVVELAFQFDASERGFTIKDLYGRIYDPWIGWFSLEAGSFKRQFGYETPQVQQFSVAPELARMNQTIFPQDYELGEDVIIESPAKFKPVHLRLDAALVNGDGVGVASETGAYDTKRDFIGRLSVGKSFDMGGGTKINLNATGSLYYGGVLQTATVYQLAPNSKGELVYTNITDSANINKAYYKREYYGAHFDFNVDYKIGSTLLRGEFIAGHQPGTATTSQVPAPTGTALTPAPLYLRQFNGCIAYFSQTFKQPIKGGHTIYHDFTFKFDLYNPNTQVSQSKLSSTIDAHTSVADVKFWDYGVGYVIRPANFFKFMVWYDFIQNANTQITGYKSGLKDNVLTLRTQFDFDSGWFNKAAPTPRVQ